MTNGVEFDVNIHRSRDMDDFYVPFGRMINFQTRKGKFELLSDVFEDAKERANEGLQRFLSRNLFLRSEKDGRDLWTSSFQFANKESIIPKSPKWSEKLI